MSEKVKQYTISIPVTTEERDEIDTYLKGSEIKVGRLVKRLLLASMRSRCIKHTGEQLHDLYTQVS